MRNPYAFIRRLGVVIVALLVALAMLWAVPGSARAEPGTPGNMLPGVLDVTTNLTLATVGNGQIEAVPVKTSYAYGEQVQLAAQSQPGWSFLRWESELQPALPWWNNQWDYRVLVRVGANGVARTNQPVLLDLNFTQLLAEIDQPDTFDATSIRVVEIDGDGQVLNENVPFQFEPWGGYDPAAYAAGQLVIGLSGSTSSSQTRLFHIYFGPAGPAYPPASFAPWVQLTAEGVIDEGLDAYQIDTLAGSYFYQKAAGGISSLIDADGSDWVQYSTAPGGSGEFRGIPNAVRPLDGGHLHPGKVTAQSRVVVSGPVRTIIQSDVIDPDSQELLWAMEWRFYPNHVEVTMRANTANFWFLYEGTPGGAIGPEDMLTLADGTTLPLTDSWNGDLAGPDWAFFSDANAARSLFLYDRSGEEVAHSYRPFLDSGSSDILMTVFGFGRPLSQLAPAFSVSPAYFTLGLADETAYAAIDGIIRAVSTGFSIAFDTPEYRLPRAETLPADNPLDLQMTANRTVTAYFAEGVYELELSTRGDGMGVVTADPAQGSYLFGTVVNLSATAEPGSRFAGWSGNLAGTENPIELSMTADTTVEATFSLTIYALTVAAEGGTVAIVPQRSGYTYGDIVTLTPTPDEDYTFVEWQGDAQGNQVPLQITMTEDVHIDAVFKPLHRLTTSVEAGQQGLVLVEPKKPVYIDGENVRLSALPASGWRFVGWTGDLAGQENPAVVTMEADKDIGAQFGRAATLQVDAVGDGTISASPSAQPDGYVVGETVTLTALPAVGWSFDGWLGDLSSAENPLTIALACETTVHARFSELRTTSFLPIVVR